MVIFERLMQMVGDIILTLGQFARKISLYILSNVTEYRVQRYNQGPGEVGLKLALGLVTSSSSHQTA